MYAMRSVAGERWEEEYLVMLMEVFKIAIFFSCRDLYEMSGYQSRKEKEEREGGIHYCHRPSVVKSH